ncbi:hypothetical protein [Stackebrandtia nassauensis]|uniref:hypothetical protein n=1 Tax=Stackebrandtia nassauensis TaxID=283811 RepID=UPI0001A38E43|nr:hypothetical protein [Stackebrandtia nassauensis]
MRVLNVDAKRRSVRLRVFVVYYEPAWGTNDLLPDDPSFFFRILWEGPRDRPDRGGTLQDLVEQDDYLDEGWVDDNTSRFVARVERVATRNHPMDADAWKRLSTFYYEDDGTWPDEHLLVQGDYDVEVTHVRWLDALRVGDSWATTSYPTEAAPAPGEAEYVIDAEDGDTHAAFVLGWLRQERGDLDGAVAAYRQAADTDNVDDKAKALVYLGDLYAQHDNVQDARVAYEQVVDCEDVTDDGQRYRAWASREIRRLTGTQTWVELTLSTLEQDGRDQALHALTDTCGSDAVARFGMALAQKDFTSARTILDSIDDAADRASCAAFGLELAALWMPPDSPWMPEDDEGDVSRILELVGATGRSPEGYGLALDMGAIAAESGDDSVPEMVVNRLYVRLFEERDVDAVTRFVPFAEQAHPRVATGALGFLAWDAQERDDFDAAIAWLRRGAALTDPDPSMAAGAAFQLGKLHTQLGNVEDAKEAFTQAEEGFALLEHRLLAAQQQAELLVDHDDQAGALVVLARAAFHEARLELSEEDDGARSGHRLAHLLDEAGEHRAASEVRRLAEKFLAPGTETAKDASATFHFAQSILEIGHRELGDSLLRSIAKHRNS